MLNSSTRHFELPGNLRVVVVSGGTSAERDISLRSGAAAVTALQAAGFAVDSFDPRQNTLTSRAWLPNEIAFLALHGTQGEDGTAQQELESLGVRYTGSGPRASRIAFDKVLAKRVFRRAGLPTPRFAVWNRCNDPVPLAQRLGYPLAVKPVAQGSSLGVSIIQTPRELQAALAAAATYPGHVLLERAIPGEEWTISVLNGKALPALRIQTDGQFFDFQSKYEQLRSRDEAFRSNEHSTASRCSALAERAARVLGCRGLCRVDVRVDRRDQPWLLEVNTLPGLTLTSLSPRAALEMGWSLGRLCEEMLRAA